MDTIQSPAGVIFDFDGVVVDSLAVHLTAWQMAFEKLFGTPLTDTQGLPGRSTMAIAQILSERVGQPELKVQLADLKREALRQSQLSIKLLPGVLETFAWLKQEKIPHGIASNAPRAFIENTLERCGLNVDVKFGSDDVSRPKPEPDVFLKCAKTLGISVLHHDRVMVFEDSPHGLKAAVRAGMLPVGVLTQNTHDDMINAGAKVCCQHVGEALTQGWFTHLPRPLTP
jgi:HAD superfamily hydrolase (TIGR01509 family)